MINKLRLKVLSMLMIAIFMGACSSDDDNGPSNIMTLVDKATGTFYAVDTSTGDLTELTNKITFEGNTLLGIRDIVYNSSDAKIYVTLDNDHDGKIYSVDTTTLEATLINDNDDDSWYAIAELIISNGKLVGSGYMDEPDSFAGLTEMNFDGTENGVSEFKQGGVSLDLYGGMGLELGDNANELLVSIVNDDNDDDAVILKTDLSGVVSEMISIIPTNFPVEFATDRFTIKSLEKDGKGNLFALVHDYNSSKQYFAKVDLSNATVTYIKEFASNKLQGLSKIPESIF